MGSVLERLQSLFGKTHPQQITQTETNIALKVTEFVCIGTLAYLKLLSEGTAGVHAGIIIGIFLQKR